MMKSNDINMVIDEIISLMALSIVSGSASAGIMASNQRNQWKYQKKAVNQWLINKYQCNDNQCNKYVKMKPRSVIVNDIIENDIQWLNVINVISKQYLSTGGNGRKRKYKAMKKWRINEKKVIEEINK